MPAAGRLPPGSGRPTRAEIDLQAFTHNLRLARRLGGKGREVMAVVKADAYGHGAVPLARQAVGAGAACLGVATVEEARQLREAGIREPVVILSEVAPGAEEEVVRLECTQVLFSLRAAELLERAAGKAGRRRVCRTSIPSREPLPFCPPGAHHRNWRITNESLDCIVALGRIYLFQHGLHRAHGDVG